MYFLLEAVDIWQISTVGLNKLAVQKSSTVMTHFVWLSLKAFALIVQSMLSIVCVHLPGKMNVIAGFVQKWCFYGQVPRPPKRSILRQISI